MWDFQEVSHAEFTRDLIVATKNAGQRLWKLFTSAASRKHRYLIMKQHRKGRRISQKIAHAQAISQELKELCLECCAELTKTDFDSGYCTQCGTEIPELERKVA